MNIEENYALKHLNTFGLQSQCKYFTEVKTRQELESLVTSDLFLQHLHYWLGGGSNIILPPVVDAMVIKLSNLGIEVLVDNGDEVLVKAQAGEVWHQFVLHCLSLGYSGLENLSLIPGSVGATPVQNIGAYGIEVKDIIEEVVCFDTYSSEWVTFSKADCQFKYRDSFFKHAENGRYVIWEVIFRLSKFFKSNINYGDLEYVSNELAHGRQLTAQMVSDAVCVIRQQKLPNPEILGNVGSFFHNPIVEHSVAEELKQIFPSMPQYTQMDGKVKLAAGWLIDQAGLKGHHCGHAAVHTKQALVLINQGDATYDDVLELAQYIETTVMEQFRVKLHPEPSFW